MSDVVYYYRYYETHWDDEPEAKLILAKVPVLRETKCTVVVNYFGREKRVLKKARKRFAYPTPELALQSYIARKKHHIARLEAYIQRATEGRDMAKRIRSGEVPAPEVKDGGAYRVWKRLPGSPEWGV